MEGREGESLWHISPGGGAGGVGGGIDRGNREREGLGDDLTIRTDYARCLLMWFYGSSSLFSTHLYINGGIR